jgi:hypothetical protein
VMMGIDILQDALEAITKRDFELIGRAQLLSISPAGQHTFWFCWVRRDGRGIADSGGRWSPLVGLPSSFRSSGASRSTMLHCTRT